MITTTLVTGGNIQSRAAAIAAQLKQVKELKPSRSAAIILEGLPTGQSALESMNDADRVLISHIAPGCVCCTGNITLTVTLNRFIRRQPGQLYIGLASTGHLDQIRAFLSAPPYASLLNLTADLRAD